MLTELFSVDKVWNSMWIFFFNCSKDDHESCTTLAQLLWVEAFNLYKRDKIYLFEMLLKSFECIF